MKRKVIIIGGGIGGLATAGLLAKAGCSVTVLEKNDRPGGRAGVFEADGFRFDMGPSWYLMPDVFEHYFRLMGADIGKYLQLERLDPSYKVWFRGSDTVVTMTSDLERDAATFETLEPGSGEQLKRYVERSKYQYDVATAHFMYKNYDSVFDFLNYRTAVEGRRLHVFEKMHRYVSRYFKDERTRKLMEYQLVFLGSSPYNTPALYNIMSHIDFNMGVFYPQGGIYAVVEALVKLGREHGVTVRTGAAVEAVETQDGRASGVRLAGGETLTADLVVSNADIAHTDQVLTPEPYRLHSDRYWQKRTLAPSAFILYLGLKRKVPGLVHHNLVFTRDWRQGFAEIFDTPRWPTDPSYYVCAPSVTDPGVAPAGRENLFVLVPVAPGLPMGPDDIAGYRERTLRLLADDLSLPDLPSLIEFERTYTSNDFSADYNALGGSALGLAHTINQTAIFRPNNVSKKLPGLYYVGGGTNPGIGMPICLISAELAYKRIVGDRSDGPLDIIRPLA